MHEFLLGMQEQHEITIIFVTHELEEAVPLGDRVAVMGGQPPAVKEVIAVPLGPPRRAATGAAGLIAVILLWQAAAAILRDPVVLPSATQTARAFGHYLTRPYPSQSRPLWDDLLISLRRILTGFVIGAAAGVALGAAMSASRVLRHLIDPVIEVIRPLPPLAFIPPLIVWFGIGELPKEVLIVLAIIPVVIVATVAGLDEVPDDLRLCARTLGASRRYTLLHVQIRSALPGILVGMRIAMAGAWTSIVAAEMLAATSGIGLLLDSGLRGLLLLADPSRRRLSRAQPARAAKVHSPHTYNYRAA
jgi:NitT/TauT family transport system permease protein/taurine transport system permease protein